MPKARIPANEALRLKALYDYQILDTISEKEYEHIVKLASFICDTPIALMSLVDKDRQWLKAKVGLEADETHRDLAFCAHAILEPDMPLIVEDATRDKRFTDNALVTSEPSIRFYAGCPLNTPSGYSLGTLCAIDTKPKKLSDRQLEGLQILANNVVNLLELRKADIEREQLVQKLTRSNTELERFAYIASHDLMEPLRMVSSFTDLLERHYSSRLDDRAHKYINFARTGAKRMQELVNDLLQYSRINEEVERNRKVDVDEALKIVIGNLKDGINRSGAEITCDELPVVSSNPVRLVRLLQNLIGNAIKYQEPGEKPKIHVSAKQDGEYWVFSVKDNGIGMKTEFLQQIFDPFMRLHNKEQYNGTGIGLAICRKIAEGFGGQIWVESEPGKGSVFYFTLPLDSVAPPGPRQKAM